jgi:hypothetical protein
MRQALSPSKILVFLPQAAAAMIVTKLADRGYVSVAVSTVPDAFDALRSEGFVFAITTRPNIDLVRKIRALPVINLEVFFHASISGDGAQASAKQLDSRAFLERVEFLARAAATARPDVGAGRATFLQRQEQGKSSWWSVVTNALRLQQNRRGLMDVRS